MYLLTEVHQDIEILTENTSEGKDTYIEGIFAQANKKNRNGRIYPRPVLEAAVEKYNREFIDKHESYGELEHPNDRPLPDTRYAAMRTTELKWDGDNVYGKAKVLNNQYGQQIKSLLEDGYKFGVSTRGLGELFDRGDHKLVNKYILNAVDVVGKPSGIDCYVNPLYESITEWVEHNGIWVQKQSKKPLDESAFFNALDKYLETLKKLK